MSKARVCFRPRLEVLDDRTAPAVFTWTGGGDGTTWTSGANWGTAGWPDTADD